MGYGNVIYLAGKMRGLPDLGREHFRQGEEFLKGRHWSVLNPAKLPDDLPMESYMPICLAMLREADAIALLPGWESSAGAGIEIAFAEETGKKTIIMEREYGFSYEGDDKDDDRG